MIYQIKYKEYLEYFNASYAQTIKNFDRNAPSEICETMIYATCEGGKRIRPILCYAVAEMFGLSIEKVKEFALAIEFIHSYSLVHDDLPCMDNDDYRRGKLSTHKKFGQAYGVLAGDALLNFAFEICLNKPEFTYNDAKALKILANFAGYSGMIGGQVLDLKNERNPLVNKEILYDIYINKTAKLLTAPLLVSCILSQKDEYIDALKELGYNLGIVFQITDDILDEQSSLGALGKTPHKDKQADKFTSIKVFGLDGAILKAKEHYEKCKQIIKLLPSSEFLDQLIDNIYFRKK